METMSREGIVRMKREYVPDSAALTELGGRIKLVCDTAVALHDKVERLEQVVYIGRRLVLELHPDPDGKYLPQDNWLEELKKALAELED